MKYQIVVIEMHRPHRPNARYLAYANAFEDARFQIEVFSRMGATPEEAKENLLDAIRGRCFKDDPTQEGYPLPVVWTGELEL